MKVKPIVDKSGDLTEMANYDNLPNQPDIEELRSVVGAIIAELIEIGLPIKDEKIYQFYLKYKTWV